LPGGAEQVVGLTNLSPPLSAFVLVLVHELRREQVRILGRTDEAKVLKKTRWALLKSSWNLDDLEEERLAKLQRANRPLYRAYLLKESLAAIFDRRQVTVARQKLLEWISWARRSRLAPFKKLALTIRRHLEGILAFIATGLSNGIVEGLNGKIRTITRRAYGFHSARRLISFIFLCCSGLILHPVFKTPPLHHYMLGRAEDLGGVAGRGHAPDLVVALAHIEIAALVDGDVEQDHVHVGVLGHDPEPLLGPELAVGTDRHLADLAGVAGDVERVVTGAEGEAPLEARVLRDNRGRTGALQALDGGLVEK
jgi:hypothetical protein